MLFGTTHGMVLTIPIHSYFTPLAPTQASHGRLMSRSAPYSTLWRDTRTKTRSVITSRWCQTTPAATWRIRPRSTLTRPAGNMKKMSITYGCFQVEEERLRRRLLLPRRRRPQLQRRLRQQPQLRLQQHLLLPRPQQLLLLLALLRHQHQQLRLLPDRHRRQGLSRRREPVQRLRRGLDSSAKRVV